MIEYGEVLPKSGQEKKWFNSLTPSLKKRLKKWKKENENRGKILQNNLV